MVITHVLFLTFGLILLIKCSDYFVKAAASIAKKLGISEFIIGLTLVAFGTSIPELASSIAAALRNEPGIIIGNIVGSNIANIGLIIGVSTVITTIHINEDMLKRDGYIMLFAVILFFCFALNGSLSRIESFLFLLLYIAYTFFLFQMKPKFKGKYHFKEFIDYFWNFRYIGTIKENISKAFIKKRKKKKNACISLLPILKDIFLLLFGATGVIFGARFLVKEAIFFAELFQIPSTLIGLSLIAVGTSLPELIVSVTAAKKGFGNIAVGNVIGSNIANIFLIFGISGIINPLMITKIDLYSTIPFMVLFSFLLIILIKNRWKLARTQGIIFLLLYSSFMIFLFTLI